MQGFLFGAGSPALNFPLKHFFSIVTLDENKEIVWSYNLINSGLGMTHLRQRLTDSWSFMSEDPVQLAHWMAHGFWAASRAICLRGKLSLHRWAGPFHQAKRPRNHNYRWADDVLPPAAASTGSPHSLLLLVTDNSATHSTCSGPENGTEGIFSTI